MSKLSIVLKQVNTVTMAPSADPDDNKYAKKENESRQQAVVSGFFAILLIAIVCTVVYRNQFQPTADSSSAEVKFDRVEETIHKPILTEDPAKILADEKLVKELEEREKAAKKATKDAEKKAKKDKKKHDKKHKKDDKKEGKKEGKKEKGKKGKKGGPKEEKEKVEDKNEPKVQ